MKESDYILATNLAKLRSAHRALSDTIYERQGDADLRGDALRAINKLTDMAEEAIGDLERGGKRKGAGRPREKDRRVTLAVRVEQITRLWLEEAAQANDRSMGEIVDDLVREHL